MINETLGLDTGLCPICGSVPGSRLRASEAFVTIEWTERYNVSRARVGKIGDLVVSWGSSQKTAPGYEVSAFGVKLKANSSSLEEGKRKAVALARRLLNEAQAALSEPAT